MTRGPQREPDMDRTDFNAALDALRAHRAANASFDLRAAFGRDPARFDTFSARQDDLLLDYSKCAVTGETISLLEALAKAAGVEDRRAAMFAGEKINSTEGRAVLHVALRGGPGEAFEVDGLHVASLLVDAHPVPLGGVVGGDGALHDGDRRILRHLGSHVRVATGFTVKPGVLENDGVVPGHQIGFCERHYRRDDRGEHQPDHRDEEPGTGLLEECEQLLPSW